MDNLNLIVKIRQLRRLDTGKIARSLQLVFYYFNLRAFIKTGMTPSEYKNPAED